MSHPLAFANQSIYHGKILLAGWRLSEEQRSHAVEQVALAYAPTVRAKLLDAYGWLLLAACRITQAPERPPHSVKDLPPLPKGLVRPAEVDACAALEVDGWVALLQKPITRAAISVRPGQLASDVAGVELRHFEDWLHQLEGLSEVIADAIDES